jgi:putative pyoverdin transport system ATP-binding/permease protein
LPTQGEVSFDGTSITLENINSFRQQVACIYSDYYLFKQLHSKVDSSTKFDLLVQVDFYLEVLQLKGKVELRDGYFTTLHLSDGQRRRLALLVAFLDNKSLYIFDEWAADQDPEFKKIFYYDILPNLKAQGKSIVAISHDDRYFDVADQVLIMESGRLIESNAHRRIVKSVVENAE